MQPGDSEPGDGLVAVLIKKVVGGRKDAGVDLSGAGHLAELGRGCRDEPVLAENGENDATAVDELPQ